MHAVGAWRKWLLRFYGRRGRKGAEWTPLKTFRNRRRIRRASFGCARLLSVSATAGEARRLATVLLGLSNELGTDGLIESADAIMSAARTVAEEANLAVRKTCSDEVWDAYRDAQVYLATRVRQIQREAEAKDS